MKLKGQALTDSVGAASKTMMQWALAAKLKHPVDPRGFTQAGVAARQTQELSDVGKWKNARQSISKQLK